MAGEVNEDQVFRAAALSQCLDAAAQAGAGGHWAGGQVIAVVDQGQPAMSRKAGLQQVADVIRLAHEHALFAVTGDRQGVEFDGRGRGGKLCDGLIQQAALLQQTKRQRIGKGLALRVANQPASLPCATLYRAVGQRQGAFTVVVAIGEVALVHTAVGQLQAAFAMVAPVAELALVVAVVGAAVLAFAGQTALAKASAPDVAVGTLVAALAVKLMVAELAAVQIAIGALETAQAIELVIVKAAGEDVALGIGHHPLTVRFALSELALKASTAAPLQYAQAAVLTLAKFALVVEVRAAQVPFAARQAVCKLAFITAAIGVGVNALAVELAVLELPLVVTAITVIQPALTLQ